MTSSQLFLLIAIAIVAPHLKFPEARTLSRLSLGLAIGFWIVDEWIKR